MLQCRSCANALCAARQALQDARDQNKIDLDQMQRELEISRQAVTAVTTRGEQAEEDRQCAMMRLDSVKQSLAEVEEALDKAREDLSQKEEDLAVQRSHEHSEREASATELARLQQQGVDRVELEQLRQQVAKGREEAVKSQDVDANRFAAMQDELDKLRREVTHLRSQSASQEVQVVQLRKAKAQLKEDREMLNIALDAKQQELELVSARMSCAGLLKADHIGRADEAPLLGPRYCWGDAGCQSHVSGCHQLRLSEYPSSFQKLRKSSRCHACTVIATRLHDAGCGSANGRQATPQHCAPSRTQGIICTRGDFPAQCGSKGRAPSSSRERSAEIGPAAAARTAASADSFSEGDGPRLMWPKLQRSQYNHLITGSAISEHDCVMLVLQPMAYCLYSVRCRLQCTLIRTAGETMTSSKAVSTIVSSRHPDDSYFPPSLRSSASFWTDPTSPSVSDRGVR